MGWWNECMGPLFQRTRLRGILKEGYSESRSEECLTKGQTYNQGEFTAKMGSTPVAASKNC